MQILLASNGSEYSRHAARYATLLAGPASATITLLGINESGDPPAIFQQDMEDLRAQLERDCNCPVKLRLRDGYFDEQVLAETEEHFYHLIVVGSQGRRRLGRFFLGSAAKRLARRIHYPLLVVIDPRSAIRRILICTGGEKPGETDAYIGGALAALLGAEVTVLHVMSQMPLDEHAPLDELQKDADELIRERTREGRHLRRVLDILAEQGAVGGQCQAKVRHGLVLDEIKQECDQGDYDLIVIGAHEVPDNTAWNELRQFLQDDIADQILTRTRRPVLVVRIPAQRQWAKDQPHRAMKPPSQNPASATSG